MRSTYDKLWVIWKQPADGGRRHVVGVLSRVEKQGYAFRYLESLDAAKASGFRALIELPEETEHYESGYLFSTFAQRVPSPARPDFKRLIDQWGVERSDDPMEILARSGGVQLTDRIELAEWRPDDDDLSVPLEMRVAGATKHAGGAQLREGDALSLVRQPELTADPLAVRLDVIGGPSVGYVQRQYAPMVSRLLDGGVRLEARAMRRLLEPGLPEGRWVVRLARAA